MLLRQMLRDGLAQAPRVGLGVRALVWIVVLIMKNVKQLIIRRRRRIVIIVVVVAVL